MKRRDWKIIFTAMAFVAIIGSRKQASSAKLKEDVLRLAALVEEFCNDHVINASVVVSDDGDERLMDEIIDKHVRELRETGATSVPYDRPLLIRLYDRLEHRAARVMNRMFYGNADKDELADAVLGYLNKELDAAGKAKLA
jgi:hypothetical protein